MIWWSSVERPTKYGSCRRSRSPLWSVDIKVGRPTCSFFHLDMKERTKERVKAIEKKRLKSSLTSLNKTKLVAFGDFEQRFVLNALFASISGRHFFKGRSFIFMNTRI